MFSEKIQQHSPPTIVHEKLLFTCNLRVVWAHSMQQISFTSNSFLIFSLEFYFLTLALDSVHSHMIRLFYLHLDKELSNSLVWRYDDFPMWISSKICTCQFPTAVLGFFMLPLIIFISWDSEFHSLQNKAQLCCSSWKGRCGGNR